MAPRPLTFERCLENDQLPFATSSNGLYLF
jgi:hypothetical protein